MALLLPKVTLTGPLFRSTAAIGRVGGLFFLRRLAFATHRPDSASSGGYSQWAGLQGWRESGLNTQRVWGAKGRPESPPSSSLSLEFDESPLPPSLAEWGRLILSTGDPSTKAKYSHIAYTKWVSCDLPLGIAEPPERPSRPEMPQLVSPKEIPPPKDSGLPLNAYMLHNLAHIELNAIDLAWDTVVRFSSLSDVLGADFFTDFAHVADDESRHFSWCSQRLEELGFRYGDMLAHNLLWRECSKTSGNVAARLAVIPLVQEARGLDAGPRLVSKLVGFGDNRTSSIVSKISEEELAHVAVGMFWFLRVCKKMGRVPDITFKELLKEFNVELKGPFNHVARQQAGIPREWYDDASSSDNQSKERLAEVHDRLACIISMEKDNAALHGSSDRT